MFSIEINIPRPLLTLTIVSGIAGFVMWNAQAVPNAEGGSGDQPVAQVVHDAESDIARARLEQQVLARREEILRAELDALEREMQTTHDPAVQQQLDETRRTLIALIQDQRAAEQKILTSFRQIWEAQGYAMQASNTGQSADTIDLVWPVEPALGISAHFEDTAYEERFGLPHHAIDIPALQQTVVAAAADGVITKVSDNGYGFNSLVIQHDGGFATLYGHVTEFLVEEGQHVRAGDPVALSGGRPGSKGAGSLTTGSHLHFELHKDGRPVDPEEYLPLF